MYHSFFIHSFTDVHLGCFQHLPIVNCAVMNIGVHRFLWTGVAGFLGYNLSSGIARQKAVPFLYFWGNSILFSTVAAPVCIPTNSALGFPFLHNLSNTCCLLICLLWPFWLVWWLVMLSIFSYISGPSVCPAFLHHSLMFKHTRKYLANQDYWIKWYQKMS